MPVPAFASGDVVLAWLVFSDNQARKRRPVLVVCDFGDDDLLVLPITSHPARVATDLIISDWKAAGLKLPSTVRVEKLATIGKTCVERPMGRLAPGDHAKVNEVLKRVFHQILS